MACAVLTIGIAPARLVGLLPGPAGRGRHGGMDAANSHRVCYLGGHYPGEVLTGWQRPSPPPALHF